MRSRRGILGCLSGVVGSLGLAGCSGRSKRQRSGLDIPSNPYAAELPARQFAQNDVLRTDTDGNRVGPRHHRLLLLDLDAEPSDSVAETVERAMRTLEAAFEWTPRGLFHALGWGTKYFERTGTLGDVPITHPQVLSRTADPDLQSFDAILLLESDVPSHLLAAENAMFGERDTLAGVPVDHRLGDVFSVADRRTGFLGEGLPATHADAEGIPDEIADDAPMFTGFFSGRAGTQASEDQVTISDGRYEGGTTVHLSHLTLNLEQWYGTLDESARVARMFAPTFSPADVADLGTDVPFANEVREHARTFDVVGHQEKVARARRKGEPVILRRDFNTVDGGRPGVHFVSLQRALADFRRTRKAMNGWYLRDESPQITDQQNNGILDVITVQSRANFYVPRRSHRAVPLVSVL